MFFVLFLAILAFLAVLQIVLCVTPPVEFCVLEWPLSHDMPSLRNCASKTPIQLQKASKFDELSKCFEYFQHKKEHFRVSFRRFRRVRRAKIPKLFCVEIFASTSASDARREKPRPRSEFEQLVVNFFQFSVFF